MGDGQDILDHQIVEEEEGIVLGGGTDSDYQEIPIWLTC